MNSRSGIGAGRAGDGWRSRWVAHRRRSLALLAAGLLLPAVFLGAASPRVCAAGAAPAREAATTNSTVPTVEEWLNQTVRLRKTVQATTLPGPDGKPAGEIRVGAEVRAIGLVSGKHWVAIELPDGSRAYVPREAIEYESNSTAPAAPVEQQRAATPVQSGASTSATTAPAAAPAEVAHPSSPKVLAPSARGAVRGKVERVPNASTLVVGDQRIRLSGIDPGPIEDLGPFEKWVEAQGDLICEPDAGTERYHCLTGDGVDVAEAAILNGTGRVGDGAPPEYRDSETQARNAKRGLWGQP